MTQQEELYHKIASSIPDTTESKMFGALCIKALNGKAGVMFWKDSMVFKLDGENLHVALQLKDAKIFEPADGRPMNGWVLLSADHMEKWEQYANLAMSYVKNIEVKVKGKGTVR